MNVGSGIVKNLEHIGVRQATTMPDPAQVQRLGAVLAEALNGGEELMAIIGYGVIRCGAEAEMLAFIDRYQIPFAATMDAKGVISEDHPQEQFGYVIESGFEMEIGDERFTLGKGDSYFIPANVSHHFVAEVVTPVRAAAVVVDYETQPAGAESRTLC